MIQPYPQQYTVTSIETKALCAVLRKAETGGERALVEKMIEICDPQSGLRFEEIWDWWKKHHQQDVDKLLKQYHDIAIKELQSDIKYPPNYKVTC